MYPCFYDQENYGAAIKGLLDPKGVLMPVYLSTPFIGEPNVTIAGGVQPPIWMELKIHITGLTPGRWYRL